MIQPKIDEGVIQSEITEELSADEKISINFMELVEYAAVMLSGCIFIYFASSWTSPRYPYAYGYDSAWYSMMGRAVAQGLVPYKDYFDLKGPTLFFYEAIGQILIRGRNGIFLIQCISIAAAVFFIYKIMRLYNNRIWSFISLMLFYGAYTSLLWGGNTVEELFLPLNMASLYLSLKFLKNKDYNELNSSSFIIGLSFFIIFWGKMTVTAPIIASVITVFVVLVKNSEWDKIIRCIKFFLFGGFFVSAPIFAYFAMRGAVNDMVKCVFMLGFKRGTDYYEGFSLEWEKMLIICPLCLIFGIFLWTKKKTDFYKKLLMIVMPIVTYLLLHLGTPFDYYFIIELPLFICFMTFLPETTTKLRKKKIYIIRALVSAAVFITILIFYLPPAAEKYEENSFIYDNLDGITKVEAINAINDQIPENERNDVFNLESGMIYYEVLKKFPMNKYAVNCPYFLHLYPEIKTEILERLRKEKPQWVISEDMNAFDDEDIREYVFKNYMLVDKNEAEELYWRVK
ncbi:glycosyltransferase family 39 protein [Lachnospiraceae bacterium C1.1]|nr:glycosyltransferase family 39 protein [Lachnospiraceae bacterium C1.1]